MAGSAGTLLHTDWECSSALCLLGLLYSRGSVYVCCSNQAGVHGCGLRVTHCQGTRKQCQIKAHSGELGRDCCGSNSSELFEVGGHRAAGSQLPLGLAVGTGALLGAHKVHRWTGPVPGSFLKHSSSQDVCAAGTTHAPCPCPAAGCSSAPYTEQGQSLLLLVPKSSEKCCLPAVLVPVGSKLRGQNWFASADWEPGFEHPNRQGCQDSGVWTRPLQDQCFPSKNRMPGVKNVAQLDES